MRWILARLVIYSHHANNSLCYEENFCYHFCMISNTIRMCGRKQKQWITFFYSNIIRAAVSYFVQLLTSRPKWEAERDLETTNSERERLHRFIHSGSNFVKHTMRIIHTSLVSSTCIVISVCCRIAQQLNEHNPVSSVAISPSFLTPIPLFSKAPQNQITCPYSNTE